MTTNLSGRNSGDDFILYRSRYYDTWCYLCLYSNTKKRKSLNVINLYK